MTGRAALAAAFVAAAGPAHAAIDASVTPKIGRLVPEEKLDPSFLIGFELGYRLQPTRPALGLAVEFAFSQPGAAGTATGGGLSAPYTIDEQMLSLTAAAVLTLPLWRLRLYGGLGAGVYRLRTTATVFGVQHRERQDRGGLHARAGLAAVFRHLDVLAEARYDDAGELDLASTGPIRFHALSIVAGFRVGF